MSSSSPSTGAEPVVQGSGLCFGRCCWDIPLLSLRCCLCYLEHRGPLCLRWDNTHVASVLFSLFFCSVFSLIWASCRNQISFWSFIKDQQCIFPWQTELAGWYPLHQQDCYFRFSSPSSFCPKELDSFQSLSDWPCRLTCLNVSPWEQRTFRNKPKMLYLSTHREDVKQIVLDGLPLRNGENNYLR